MIPIVGINTDNQGFMVADLVYYRNNLCLISFLHCFVLEAWH